MKGLPLIKSEDGGAIVIVFLIILPLLIATSIYTNETERLITGSNQSLNNTVALAVKAAAQSVDNTSQAYGTPVIDASMAHENFKKILEKNLKLDLSLNAVQGSPIKGGISYDLLICNGTNNFGVDEGVIYSYKDGSLTVDYLATGSLPQTIGVNENFNIYHEGKQVTFEKPGALAIIKGEIKPIAMKKGEVATRWAAARIVY